MNPLARASLALILATPLGAQSLPEPYFPSNPESYSGFGFAAAVDGDLAVLGASNSMSSGAVYIYGRTAGAWIEQARLVEPTGLDGAGFGTSVAVSGQRIAVGAKGWGAEYVKLYEPVGGSWVEVAHITPSVSTRNFGQEVELEDDTLVVGAPEAFFEGRVFVFERGTTGWTQTTMLTGNPPSFHGRFGKALSLDGDQLAIGSPQAKTLQGFGQVFIYGRSGSSWSQVAEFSKSQLPVALTGGSNYGLFGAPLKLHGSDLLVGVADDAINSSAVYTYERQAGGWTPTDRLQLDDGGGWGDFPVDLFGDLAIVGSPEFEGGRALLFQRAADGSGSWSLRETLVPEPALAGHFGDNALLNGTSVLITSPGATLGLTLPVQGLARDPLGGTLFMTDGAGLFTLTSSPLGALPVGDTGYSSLRGLAFDGAGALFAVDVDTDELLQLDPLTGQATSIGVMNLVDQIEGLTFDPASGGLFGSEVVQDVLVSIDPATAQVTTIGPLGFQFVGGLAFDTQGQALYGLASGLGRLIRIDTATGVGVLIGKANVTKVKSLGFDPSNGALDAIGETSGAIYSIDPLSANTTVIGNTEAAIGAWSYGAPDLAVNYCTAGASANGCTALLTVSGQASASETSGFQLDASGASGSTQGLFLFSTNGRQANPWGNTSSLLCVAPPIRRTPPQLSTGSNGTCVGAFSEDLNALWCAACPKPSANPGPGIFVQAQLWYRDPLGAGNFKTALSDAVEFLVGL